MTPIVGYLKKGKLLQGKDETRKLRIKSVKYVLMDEVLYKRGFFPALPEVFSLGRSQLCIEGSSWRSIWQFSNVPRQPSEYLTPMMAPWLFAQWRLDILGPFPTETRQMKFLVVGIDYFTKWVEAEPLVKITQQNVKNFVWKSIVCRFGVPRVLVSDNGWQFARIFVNSLESTIITPCPPNYRPMDRRK